MTTGDSELHLGQKFIHEAFIQVLLDAEWYENCQSQLSAELEAEGAYVLAERMIKKLQEKGVVLSYNNSDAPFLNFLRMIRSKQKSVQED